MRTDPINSTRSSHTIISALLHLQHCKSVGVDCLTRIKRPIYLAATRIFRLYRVYCLVRGLRRCLVWGYNPAWIAGAIISGAYFGDKVSPLSDTTVLKPCYQYKYGYEGGHERRGSMLMRIFHQIQICVFCGCKVINKTP